MRSERKCFDNLCRSMQARKSAPRCPEVKVLMSLEASYQETGVAM